MVNSMNSIRKTFNFVQELLNLQFLPQGVSGRRGRVAGAQVVREADGC